MLMVCGWLLSQVLVVSNSQAHTAMGHQSHMAEVAQPAQDGDPYLRHHSDKQHSHDKKTAASDHGVPVNLPHSMDECCDIACQSATVVNSSELAVLHETSAAFNFVVRSASCWSPGFVNPPPNPAA
jgi:hypothetical protein